MQCDILRANGIGQKHDRGTDRKLGACFMQHERSTLAAERRTWERQVEQISLGRYKVCRPAIRAYRVPTRKATSANFR